ncbi:cytochrome P450 CYP4/CYP19/CYP26 subfamily protein [Trichoderma chlorosporum]
MSTMNETLVTAISASADLFSSFREDVGAVRLLGLVVLATIAAILVHLFQTWWSLRHIPGPFLASLTNLQRVWWVKTGRAHLYHQAVHEKYGDIVRIGPHMVSVSNPEAIQTIYPIRSGFPKSDFYSALRPYSSDRGSMLLVFNTQDEQMHKRLKSPIAPLFSLSNTVTFEGLVDDVLACLSEQLNKRFVETAEIIDFGKWVQFFAFDVMGTMSFSKRYGFLDQGQDAEGMLDAIFNYMKTAAPMTQIPWLDPWFYKNKIVHRFRQTPGMSILGVVSKNIRERLDNIDGNNDDTVTETRGKDFLARFLEIHRASPDLPPWASTAWTFSNVIAGSDSVGSVMRTILYNLVSHPDTLQALQRELDAANLSRPYPKWNEVRDLEYLDACVQEAVRIHPPFALPFERVVPTGGVNVMGKYLPGGVLVGGNPYVVNRHKPTFGANVEDWSPERWLVDESHKKKLEQSILTFGAGRRVCLGKYIGLFEVKKLIPFLILNYDIQIIDPKALTVENGFFFKQEGFNCRIKKREQSSTE